MSPHFLESGLLLRIEELLDALEARGNNSKEFLNLCSELQTCLETAPTDKIMQEQVGGLSDDLKNRLELISSRIKKLENFSSMQTEITSRLQKHIVGADK